MSIARAHASAAATTLRHAAPISDPYKRADVIWGAVERIESAADRLHGRKATVCADIARYLQEGCEAGAEPPAAPTLIGYARVLDGI